jgi:hypothetical protein
MKNKIEALIVSIGHDSSSSEDFAESGESHCMERIDHLQ